MDPGPVGAFYRAVLPSTALRSRGHELVEPRAGGGQHLSALLTCDAVLIYRRYTEADLAMAKRLVQSGVRVVYDNDDDYSSVERHHPAYRAVRRDGSFKRIVRIARASTLMTTTTTRLASQHRKAGIPHVEVIPNLLDPAALRAPHPHEGLVVGYVGAREHTRDLDHIPVAAVLRSLLESVPSLRVESIGVDLGLDSPRYRHDPFVPHPQLGSRIAGWDIGLAPLMDTPFNASRSDIKLKEYAACQVPWIASATGPYAELGRAEGGVVVGDDGWYDALAELLTDQAQREELAQAAGAWAQRSTIAAGLAAWERALFGARAQPPTATTTPVPVARPGAVIDAAALARYRR